ncbi:MAG: ester cyclase [Chloroflexi bacterium]|nr:ester cyclase [Chloroflexota bacterium]MBV9132235.1 ester cyclase [Chloroflexota bacterium]MBV9893055.1 ester cyclase [Chloroflexota bacterium]
MTMQTNKVTVEEWFETWNQRDWDKFTTFISPETEMVTVATGENLRGHAGWRQVWDLWNTGFPGHRLTITNLIAGDEGVAVEAVFDGTHSGPFGTPAGDIPATGKSVHTPFVGYTLLENGRVTSYHLYFDTLTILAQLGVAPTSA